MALRIPMTAEVLGRSRFGISPCVEVFGGVRALLAGTSSAGYLQRWSDRAMQRVHAEHRELLTGLVSSTGYTPDLLTPAPTAPLMSIDDEMTAIAATDAEDVSYQLDIAFRGRDIPANVAETVGGPAALDSYRRPMPPAVAAALSGGYRIFAERVAEAVGAYFHHVIETDWASVHDVLAADIAYRGMRMTTRGAIALLDDLHADVYWDSDAAVVRRTWEHLVDWPHDGLLLVPAVGIGDRLLVNAERPLTPSLLYPARGTGRLSSNTQPRARTASELGELIGHTRAELLMALRRPFTTTELGRHQALTDATVSYHLGILHKAGLVRRQRTGRRVVYEQTELAIAMITGGRATTDP